MKKIYRRRILTGKYTHQRKLFERIQGNHVGDFFHENNPVGCYNTREKQLQSVSRSTGQNKLLPENWIFVTSSQKLLELVSAFPQTRCYSILEEIVHSLFLLLFLQRSRKKKLF